MSAKEALLGSRVMMWRSGALRLSFSFLLCSWMSIGSRFCHLCTEAEGPKLVITRVLAYQACLALNHRLHSPRTRVVCCQRESSFRGQRDPQDNHFSRISFLQGNDSISGVLKG
ncbi:uncharacterized protein EV420DRAFT_1595048 [Desarmillaria tabescens]|uniref:Uncharacterized protein n=1 Tax=Armillaria tabescens TaxID=1929756 RepID=A0AA39J2N7_ARMTA|nr:uncharacterized protein EV420DRAFT_1595048 [Desarmillaria tabescens]KAK0434978.1 hypothetical protein EV420DRAFT_1595048 [Desarmillaria tabescens]